MNQSASQAFLRVLRNGEESLNFTFPQGSEICFACGLPGASSAKFYLGNDQRVLLSEEAPLLRMEGNIPVFGLTLQTDVFCSEGKGLFFFHFEAETEHGRIYTVADGSRLSLADRFVNEFQLTVYQQTYQAPDWLDGGVFYHIFVDRFYKSGKANRKPDTPYREDWEHDLPEFPPVVGQSYPNNTHFGGDLYGVTEKLPYLQELGVTVLYLSPVCEAYSNHKYDTGNYLRVDESFGGEEALSELVREAHARGMRVILDGVFNHVGDDSIYFNRYGTYPSVGACQSAESPYYPWFRFERYPEVYDCWWGIRNLPKTVKCEGFRKFICEQVIPKYMRMGIDGYRLDVADELDVEFLDEIVAAIKREKPDAAVIGEVWEDASNKIAYGIRRRYLQGDQLDGVMNYPLRNGLLSFLQEGDASLLRQVTEMLYCHYPPHTLAHTMNSIGTHDTERILTLLGGEPDLGEENATLATKRMTEAQRQRAISLLCCGYTLLAAMPGVPCIYYGDEAGLEGYHDPFNRMPFPWNGIDKRLHDHVQAVNRMRSIEPLFAATGFATEDSEGQTFVCRRFDPKQPDVQLWVLSNRSAEEKLFSVGGRVRDLLTGECFSSQIPVGSDQTRILKTEL